MSHSSSKGRVLRGSLATKLVRTDPELAAVDEDDFQQAIASRRSRFRTGFWHLLQPAFAVGDERMTGMQRCRFDDDFILKANHLKADVADTPKQLCAARVLPDLHGELFVSGLKFFHARVRPEDGFAFNPVIRMASHREVSRLISMVLLFRLREGQCVSGQLCAMGR